MALSSPSTGVDIAYAAQMANKASELSHRDGGIEFRTLFEGDEDDKANNYILALVTQKEFHSPVHHHNFEQFRFAWKGDFNMGPHNKLKEGQLGYTSEGTWYGPQLDDDAESRTLLLLQFGGASGQGFTGLSTLKKANSILSETGRFEGGKYYPNNGSNPVDGYEALWNYTNAPKKVHYPVPRYQSTVTINPESFSWKRVTPADGTESYVRLLGKFTERGCQAQQWKLEAGGCCQIEPAIATQFLIVQNGSGTIDGNPLEVESAVRLQPGVGAQIVSQNKMQLLHFILPTITS